MDPCNDPCLRTSHANYLTSTPIASISAHCYRVNQSNRTRGILLLVIMVRISPRGLKGHGSSFCCTKIHCSERTHFVDLLISWTHGPHGPHVRACAHVNSSLISAVQLDESGHACGPFPNPHITVFISRLVVHTSARQANCTRVRAWTYIRALRVRTFCAEGEGCHPFRSPTIRRPPLFSTYICTDFLRFDFVCACWIV